MNAEADLRISLVSLGGDFQAELLRQQKGLNQYAE